MEGVEACCDLDVVVAVVVEKRVGRPACGERESRDVVLDNIPFGKPVREWQWKCNGKRLVRSRRSRWGGRGVVWLLWRWWRSIEHGIAGVDVVVARVGVRRFWCGLNGDAAGDVVESREEVIAPV